jgi:uncharacterized membrane protein
MATEATTVDKKAFRASRWSHVCLCLAGISTIHTAMAFYWTSAAPPLVSGPSLLDRTAIGQFCSSRTRRNRWVPSRSPILAGDWLDPPSTSTTLLMRKDSEMPERKLIVITSSIELPFPAETAYDAFSDLRRQPSWSPWLRSVEYINDDGTAADEEKTTLSTLWTLKMSGFQFSWTAIETKNERPTTIQWESTSGLKNFGTVRFEPMGDPSSPTTTTLMTMNLSFVTPKVIAALFRRSKKIQSIVEEKMIRTSMASFRDVVVEDDLKQ